MTLCDTENRSFIDTKHEIAGLDSRKDLIKNADGSVDLYFGPKAPAGKESNWTPTDPKGEFEILFRFYGPLPSLFDKSWVLPDIEIVK